MLQDWELISTHKDNSYRIFQLRIDKAKSPRTCRIHEFYILESTDWVNVIPLTTDNQVVMIRQYRHGIRDFTLEIPGGLVEKEDSPETAAQRELVEETGYRGEKIHFVGYAHPNPAIQNNTCYTYLIKDVEKSGDQVLDEKEDIETVLYPLKKIPDLIKNLYITHSLVQSAFFQYMLHVEPGYFLT